MMYKIFTLAVAISVLPVTYNLTNADFVATQNSAYPNNIFPYKNTVTTNLFEPEKKGTEPWSQNWMTAAQENIRKSEYHFTWEEKLKAYVTPNRKNNFRFFYTDKGFSVEPRTTKIPIGEFDPMAAPDEIKYKRIPNWKIKFNLDKMQVGKGLWKLAENKAEYITNKITVQYINNDDGMRQNFIVHQPLSKADELKINFSIKTKLNPVLNNDRLQFLHKKNIVLNYEDLKVWDAAGKSLSASFIKKRKGKYVIQVDAKDAVYPITIDPISTTPAATVESNQVNANLGFSVASAGDVNADGYSDVITGVPAYDNPQLDEGAAFIFHGSATGINTTAAAIVESNLVGARLGISVSTAGDVNGDGFSDIVVGANNYSNAETWEGAVYIYHGSPTGINTTAAIMMESNQAQAQMGFSVACAGDVNGDGYSDVIVGVWLFDNPEINEGVAYIYHGSATGISGTIATIVEANQSASNFGIAVAGAGDVNGDGYSDVIVGAEDYDNGQTDEGVAFIYLGSAAGINSTAQTFVEGNLTLSQFGFSVASAGDVNGDGYSDVIVGAYLSSNGQANEGCAFVYHGSASGIINIVTSILECNQIAASFGISVACAGDVNGDGYSDVIVGATQYDNVESNEGAAFVFQGSATGITTVAVAILESNQASAQMGRGVASGGDVNGDGYSDVIVGAPQYDNPESNEGAAFVYHGSATGINSTAALMLESNQVSADFGRSVAGAGDVNSDGYSDIIVGIPLYDNGQSTEGAAFVFHGSATGINTPVAAQLECNQANAQMGISVGGAGDVNGDGYSDVIVGAFQYTNGENVEGAFFVYHGSATGVNTTAAIQVESNEESAHMGNSVAGAGDVNGDGYGDIIVGAYTFSNGETGEGAAFVYLGSATGVVVATAVRLEPNQADAGMGFSVAGAGDVNGDGYGDVVVGSPGGWTNDNGLIYVYHGSSSGINGTAATQILKTAVFFGGSVAGAGDVNGDGYSDIIAGASDLGIGGAAFVYHGSATGINTTAAAQITGTQATAYLGRSVAGAGDVDGDGYSDVIVGAPYYSNGQLYEGVAFIYHGGTAGVNTIATAIVESNQGSAYMGWSVAGAGDINGDGYSDVITGAWAYDNGQNGEGAVFVYNGNNIGGLRNNLRLYNTDLTTSINKNNSVFSNFGAGLFTKSFLGRDSGKLVWETRLHYNPYSGTPITNSTLFTAQQNIYTNLGGGGIELKNIVAKILGGRYTKLRARVKYNPIKAITGQAYGPWRYVSSILAANDLGALPLDLISFNAAWLQKGKTARLDFKTDKESGICCFDIEKSSDGFNFYSIGTLPAKNVSGIQSYSFIDGNATSKNQFYRIKIKGIAGQPDYSNIQQLQNDKTTEILVFPNPTTDKLQFQFNKWYDKMNVRIINSAGQTIKQFTALSVSGQTLSIPVHDLPAGRYWLTLQSGDEKQLLQFVKQ